MPPPPLYTDLQLLQAIATQRERTGACTLRGLGAELGMSFSGVRRRMTQLIERGLVTRHASTSGSLRLTPAGERMRRAGLLADAPARATPAP